MEGFGKRCEKNNTYDKCENIFYQERARVKRFREEAEEGKQESPARECLEQVECCNDTDRAHRMMKQGFFVLKGGG